MPTPEEELEQARGRLYGGPASLLVSVQAQYGDGTPARGQIACDGLWCKFDEVQYCASNLPFQTDSRGVCIFNPSLDYLSDGDPMVCRATVGTRSGTLTFSPVSGGLYVITIPGTR